MTLSYAHQRTTPNIGGGITPEYVVMHYTAGGTTHGAVSWLCNPDAAVSAHVVIGRDGETWQLAPFNIKTKHAGQSEYNGRKQFNGFSVGVELVNWGALSVTAVGFKSYTGKLIPDDDRVRAKHKNETEYRHWQKFPPEQIAAAVRVVADVCREYAIPVANIIGHDDIAPGRKQDPGPAFDMKAFRKAVEKSWLTIPEGTHA